jgi:hypothetical protein
MRETLLILLTEGGCKGMKLGNTQQRKLPGGKQPAMNLVSALSKITKKASQQLYI